MKTIGFLATLLAAFFTQAAAPIEAPATRQMVIGLSPFLENYVKDEVYRGIVRLVVEELPLGTRLGIYDAYHLRTITHIDIPEVRAFASSKTRANQFSRQIGELKQFLARAHEKPEAKGLTFADAIRLPQWMQFIANNIGGGSESTPLSVIVFGNPLYMDHREPSFSMVDGYFPSDAHLAATRDKSVYSLESRSNALPDVLVHFGYFGEPWLSELHRDKIARFWSLYLQGQSASLATFTGDIPTVFKAAKNPARSKAPRHQLDPSQTKVEMLRISREVDHADWLTRDSITGAITPPSRTVGPMKIGIRWKARIDLDLYARGRTDAEMLYFEHTRSQEGYYYKDHRSSPDREYEFIEFESPVDVWKAEARINFFEGRVGGDRGPAGEIRIEFDGKIYTGEFAIAASRGNEGRTGARQASYWNEIDIPSILKLR